MMALLFCCSKDLKPSARRGKPTSAAGADTASRLSCSGRIFAPKLISAGEQKYGHRKIKSRIKGKIIRLSSIAIFMFVFTFDLLCAIMKVNIRNEVYI